MNEAGGFKTAPLRNGVKALEGKVEEKEENSGLLSYGAIIFRTVVSSNCYCPRLITGQVGLTLLRLGS
jgi:hypothetical protein